MRTILAVLISTIATQSNAFDINLNGIEIRRLQAEYLIDDLSVGVKAVVSSWAFCAEDDRLYLNRAASVGEPSKWTATFEVSLLPSGETEAVIVPAGDISANSLPFPSTQPCDEELRDLGFYPVNSINGADNFAEFISVALGKGYTIDNKKAARELRPLAQPKDTYAGVFTSVYEEKIKGMISNCLVATTTSLTGIADDANLVVSVSFSRDGKVKPSSISLHDHSINSDTRAKFLYEGTRRAFLRCQKAGYSLPEENYESWETLKITFSKADFF